MKRIADNNLSLFDNYEQEIMPIRKIDVLKLSYISSESLSWCELFSGYSELYAITFSSGINFVYTLLDMFEKAEIIFGNESVMSYSMQEIMSYQHLLLSRMRDSAGERRQNLLDRIDNETVRFFVARKQLSHEKIYLLKADDGKKRVIMGSANMSYKNAFNGCANLTTITIPDSVTEFGAGVFVKCNFELLTVYTNNQLVIDTLTAEYGDTINIQQLQ